MNNLYLAGLFDGEGCISIRKTFRSGKNGKRIWFMPTLSCNQSDLPLKRIVIEEFKNRFGGTINKEPGRGNSRDSVRWSLQGTKKILSFLDELEPYLFIKQPHCVVIRRFLKTCRIDHNPAPLSIIELTKKETLFVEMKKLNSVGKFPVNYQ